MRRRVAAVLLGLLLPYSLAACSDGEAHDSSTLTIFAASSLTEAFGTLERDFEAEHDGVDVVISFGSSSTLADQIAAGAPADVVATADARSMATVTDADLTTEAPTKFATNTLVVVTPPDNPAGVSGIHDLGTADFVMCDPAAPCGAAAQTVLANAGITTDPKSYEADVKSVLAKVTLNEADAGLVYVSDATTAGSDVHAVAVPPSLNVVNPYFIARVQDSPEPDLAAEWVSLVTSDPGQRVLKAAGFGPA